MMESGGPRRCGGEWRRKRISTEEDDELEV